MICEVYFDDELACMGPPSSVVDVDEGVLEGSYMSGTNLNGFLVIFRHCYMLS